MLTITVQTVKITIMGTVLLEFYRSEDASIGDFRFPYQKPIENGRQKEGRDVELWKMVEKSITSMFLGEQLFPDLKSGGESK